MMTKDVSPYILLPMKNDVTFSQTELIVSISNLTPFSARPLDNLSHAKKAFSH